MHLTKFQIQNFKSFENVELLFDPRRNVLTGANNSGKTTVLEALALWAECFRARTWQTAKASTRMGTKAKQWSLDYYGPVLITSVRKPSLADIFYNLDTKSKIVLTASFEDGGRELALPFSIRHASGGQHMVEFVPEAGFTYNALNEFFERWPEPVKVLFASPVANILAHEEFHTPPKIAEMVKTRQSMPVLRNRLYQLRKDLPKYQRFLDDVSTILNEGQQPLALKFLGDEGENVGLSIQARIGPRDVSKDLSLLGSGTLQIMEIMLAIHAERSDLNLILLDEPDSHIHRDLQRRLIEKIASYVDRTQLFLTTHNESLIRATRPEHLFHLENKSTASYRAVYHQPAAGKRIGLQPSPQLKVLTALGGETALDFLNALEAERLVLVEGENDAKHIQRIVQRGASPEAPFHAMYWAFGGVDTMLDRIDAYRELFQAFRNQKSLWDKAVLVLDRDYMTSAQSEKLKEQLMHRLQRPVYISKSYTMESTILSEVDKLVALLRARIVRAHPSVVVEPHRISDQVTEALQALTDRLRARVTDKKFLEDRYLDLRRRRELLERHHIKGVLPKDQTLQPDFQMFAREALDQAQLNLLATKEDVAEVIRAVYQGLGLPMTALPTFADLIEAATPPSPWFAEWSELRAYVLKG